MERYSTYNPEIGVYTVKYLGKRLLKDLDLSQNGVTLKHDESVREFVPVLILYYQDTLTSCNDIPWNLHDLHIVYNRRRNRVVKIKFP